MKETSDVQVTFILEIKAQKYLLAKYDHFYSH